MKDDLARSGLTVADAKRLRMRTLTAAQTKKLVKKELRSYRIPYFTLDGKEDSFYRVRMLQAPPARFGGKGKRKVQRYTQPSGHPPALYMPPLLDVSWRDIAADPERPLCITEGEKKAAKACKHGLPTIGLGGVWSYMSRTHFGYGNIHPDLEAFEWLGRRVALVFDSDLADNANVAKALDTLIRQLNKRGAIVSVGYLPDAEDGSKQGLDDYLVANAGREQEALDQLRATMDEEGQNAELTKLNAELAYVQRPPAYFHIPTKQLFRSPKALMDGPYANAHHWKTVRKENKEGGVELVPKLVNTAKEWAGWQHRRTHAGITYAPGEDVVTADGMLNTWEGWGVQPEEGDVQPFLDLFEHVFQGLPEQTKRWLWQWMAYPLQYPGTKLYSAVMVHGRAQGTGKSFIGYILGDIYGNTTNFSKVNQGDLFGSFNEYVANKQFILGEEITGGDKRAQADRLKDMISNELIRVKQKYQPEYQVPDMANYWLTSNQPDALYLEDDDRRAFVHRLERKAPQSVYDAADRWRKQQGGPAALFRYLLTEVDCAGFNPTAPAPMTEAKAEMIANSRTDIEAWADALLTDPDSMLGDHIKRDTFTAKELMQLYDPDETGRVSGTALGKALERRGCRQKVVKTKQGTQRLRAVRNLHKWYPGGDDTASPAEWAADYDGTVVSMTAAASKRKKPHGNQTQKTKGKR